MKFPLSRRASGWERGGGERAMSAQATTTKSDRERAWEQVFLRLLSLPREKAYNFVFIIDKDGFPSGGVTGEGKLEWNAGQLVRRD